jgi:hypothetical protein
VLDLGGGAAPERDELVAPKLLQHRDNALGLVESAGAIAVDETRRKLDHQPPFLVRRQNGRHCHFLLSRPPNPRPNIVLSRYYM